MQQQEFNHFFQQFLNEAQQQAVQPKEGILLVTAGAGSGKTRVITSRIVNLMLNHSVSASAILALTFTNKAAAEMKERIERFLPNNSSLPFIGTFHSYCLLLLKIHGHFLGLDTFTILDSDDQLQLLNTLIKRHHLEKRISAKNLASFISSYKNSLRSTKTAEYQDPLVMQLMQHYEQEKKLSKSLDFDDLLLETLTLFEKHSVFKYQFQQRIKHVLVDEYQDTNLIQHELLKHMTLNEKQFCSESLCVVGDEDQSIYSWRGATVANILHFKKDFAATKTIKIEQNYRSVQPILDIANAVIENNTNRNPKRLWSDKPGSNRAYSIACISAHQEGLCITQFLTIHKDLRNVAILYRAHYQSRVIEESLIRQSIAYRIIGGIQFYERKEVKDILAYLRLIANPFDRVAFFRVINCPTRGLGQKFEQDFYALWEQQPLYSFIDVAQELLANGSLTGTKKKSLHDFVEIIKSARPDEQPAVCIERIVQQVQYYTYLKENFDLQEAVAKIDNIKELQRGAAYAQEHGSTTLHQFLHEVALMQEKASKSHDESHDHVQLMTVHAAKGLEFKTVIIAGLEEGLFPSTHAQYSPEALEEERRLFYVAITRAQERILLTSSRYRALYGTVTEQKASRFIQEIPEKLLKKMDGSQWTGAHYAALFSQWLDNKAPTVFTFKTASPASSAIATHGWYKNQRVSHPTFGIGIIKEIEKRAQDIYIAAQFPTGLKKVKASFLKRL